MDGGFVDHHRFRTSGHRICSALAPHGPHKAEYVEKLENVFHAMDDSGDGTLSPGSFVTGSLSLSFRLVLMLSLKLFCQRAHLGRL